MDSPKTLQDKRKLRIAELLYSKKVVPVEEIEDTCRREQLASDPRTIEKDLQVLEPLFGLDRVGSEVRWPSVDLRELFHNTAIGTRLSMRRDSKKRLAKCTVGTLASFEPPPRRLLLCAGSTVYEIAKEIFSRNQLLTIDYVYTNNLLVLCEGIMVNPPNITIELLPGQVERDPGIIMGKGTLNSLRKVPVDTVIMSFGGLSLTEGFSSDKDRDEQEKRVNLRPYKDCKWILIPISWDKIGVVEKLVATDKHLDKSGRRGYIIITDPPEGNIDQQKKHDLRKWASAQRVVKVIYAG